MPVHQLLRDLTVSDAAKDALVNAGFTADVGVLIGSHWPAAAHVLRQELQVHPCCSRCPIIWDNRVDIQIFALAAVLLVRLAPPVPRFSPW